MAEFPAPTEGILLTHFIVSDDVERSRRFYTDVLGGGPTEDKPTVTLETPYGCRPRGCSGSCSRGPGGQDRGGEIRCYIRDPDGHLIEVGQTSPAFLEQIGSQA
jgi:catechol 2,3-dioxygenase-like lactoylglutathione lyase family enzyme